MHAQQTRVEENKSNLELSLYYAAGQEQVTQNWHMLVLRTYHYNIKDPCSTGIR